MDEYVDLCLSKEDMETEHNGDILSRSEDDFPDFPLLRRFPGHNEEILSPEYVGQSEQGIVFKYQERTLCLKLVRKLHLASPFLN